MIDALRLLYNVAVYLKLPEPGGQEPGPAGRRWCQLPEHRVDAGLCGGVVVVVVE